MVDLAELELRIKTTGVQQARRRVDELDRSVDRNERTVTRWDRTQGRATRTTRRLGRETQQLTRQMRSLFGGLALIGAATPGIRTLSRYGETMAQVQGIAIRVNQSAAAQAEQFDRLRAATLRLGASTRFSAREVGEAQLFLARTGFEVDEILGALPGTLSLAAATSIDLGSAADLASNALKQFALDATEMDRVADVLANTTIRTNTDVTQLAEALKLSGPVARALGLSIEETTAAIGKLGDAGLQGSLAGTQLRGILAALSAPTSMARREFEALAEQLGVSVDLFDLTQESADGVTPPLFRILRLFREAGTSADQFFRIFGRRQAAGGIILSESIDALEALVETQNEASGTAQRLANIQEDTLAGAFRRLAAASEALVLSFEESDGALRAIVDTLAEAIRILAGAEGAMENASTAGLVLARSIQVAGLALGALASIKVVGFFVAAGGVILTLATGPVGIAVAALATLAGAFKLVEDASISFGGRSSRVGDVWAATWEVGVRRLGAAFRVLATLFTVTVRLAVEFARDFIEVIDRGLVQKVRALMLILGFNFGDAMQVVFDVARFFLNKVIALFVGAFNTISSQVEKIANIGDLFADIDLSSPRAILESIARFSSGLEAGLAPTGLLRTAGEEFAAAFERDYVGEIATGIRRARALIRAAFGREGEQFLNDFDLTFNPARILAEIDEALGRIEQARVERREAIAEQVGGIISDGLQSFARNPTLGGLLGGLGLSSRGGIDIPVIPTVDPEKLADIERQLDEIAEAEAAAREAAAEPAPSGTLRGGQLGLAVALQTVDTIQTEIDLLQLAGAERRTELTILQARDEVLRSAAELSDRELERALDQVEARRDEIAALERQVELIRQYGEIGEGVGRTIGDGLAELALRGGELEDVINRVGLRIAEIGFEQFVTRPLAEQLGQLGAGIGANLGSGEVAAAQAASAALSTAAQSVAASLGSAGSAAASALASGGQAAASAILSAASQAASILGTGSAVGSATAAGARGLVGGGGRVTALARGGRLDRGLSAGLASGVVSSPTMVPQALIGEGARKEGVFPLEQLAGGGLGVMASIGGRRVALPIGRLSDGNLGVRTDGELTPMQRGGLLGSTPAAAPAPRPAPTRDRDPLGRNVEGPRSMTTVFNITTPDADSFRRSRRQIDDDQRRSFRLGR